MSTSEKDTDLEYDLPDSKWRQVLRRKLLAWYDRGARNLPWRQNRDPYRVWISEIMLQQTQVATVIPYFERFMQRFPDVKSLAKAKEAAVLQLWEGLGYYRRARQLHKAAKQIVGDHAGSFPTEFDDILGLPGIGRYTAGAITSIAYDRRSPILEANSMRVYCRLWGMDTDPHSTLGQKSLWEFAEEVLPRKRCGDFNQAVMELGSEICSPNEPKCSACPLSGICCAFLSNRQAVIPVPKKKLRYEEVREVAVVVWRDGQVLLRECKEGERWAGLWDFPRFSADHLKVSQYSSAVRRLTGIGIRTGNQRTTIKHGVTRFRITLDCYDARYSSGKLTDNSIRWISPSELAQFPLSVTGRKIARLLV